MKFSIPTILLADLTKQLSYILETKKGLTSYGKYVKISAYGPQIALEVVHDQASLLVHGEARIFEEGIVGVSGKMLSDIVAACTSEYVTFSVHNGMLKIQSDRRVFNLTMFDPNQFLPSPPYSSGEYYPVEGFFKAVGKVAHCTAHDESRPLMGCVLVKNNTIAATDGRRLAIYKLNCPTAEIMSVPYEWLQPIKRAFTNEVVEICMLNSSLHFRQGTTYGSIRLYGKNFPNVESVIPKGPCLEAFMGKLELLNALKSAKIVSTNDSNVVNLRFAHHELTVSIQTTVGQMEDIVPCAFEQEFESSFNLDYLIDALKKLDKGDAVFSLRHPNSPLLIKEDDYLQIIMPIQK